MKKNPFVTYASCKSQKKSKRQSNKTISENCPAHASACALSQTAIL